MGTLIDGHWGLWQNAPQRETKTATTSARWRWFKCSPRLKIIQHLTKMFHSMSKNFTLNTPPIVMSMWAMVSESINGTKKRLIKPSERPQDRRRFSKAKGARKSRTARSHRSGAMGKLLFSTRYRSMSRLWTSETGSCVIRKGSDTRNNLIVNRAFVHLLHTARSLTLPYSRIHHNVVLVSRQPSLASASTCRPACGSPSAERCLKS